MNKFGFTILEILIVVLLIGILSTIGLGVYFEQQKVSRDADRKANLIEIKGALQDYFSINKKYPLLSTHRGSDIDPGRCFYFSNGGYQSLDNTASDNPCYRTGVDPEPSDWIPDLKIDYIDSLPNDPKYNLIGNIGDFNECTKKLIQAQNGGATNRYEGCDKNYWSYFYTSRLGSEFERNDPVYPLAQQKFFILGAALENRSDKESIGANNKKVFNIPNELKNSNPIPSSIKSAPNNGMPINLFILTSAE